MQLVLVAGRFPYALAPGSRLLVHHDREGKPINEILVMAIFKAGSKGVQLIRTDPNGRAFAERSSKCLATG